MFDTHEYYPEVAEPSVDLGFGGGVDHIDDHFLNFLPKSPRLFNGRPIVVAFVEVVPVHLIDSHCEYLLEFFIDAGFNYPVIDELVHVDCSGVTEVEDEWVS